MSRGELSKGHNVQLPLGPGC